MKEQCWEEIQKNGNLPSNITQQIEGLMCDNDCSRHGQCVDGRSQGHVTRRGHNSGHGVMSLTVGTSQVMGHVTRCGHKSDHDVMRSSQSPRSQVRSWGHVTHCGHKSGHGGHVTCRGHKSSHEACHSPWSQVKS